MIYRKILNLPLNELASTGELINMTSTDTEKFQQAGIYFNNIWHGPFDALIILIYGYLQIGVSFVVGFCVVVLLLPLQAWLSHRFAALRMEVATVTDQRVKMTSQAIAGIRQIKLSGWEWPFRDHIEQQRREEMVRVKQASNLKALNESIFFVSCSVVAFTTFATYWALGNHLTPHKVFTTLVLLNAVQLSAAKYFAYGMQAGAEAYASAKRVQRLLEMQEVSKPSQRQVSVTVDGASVSDVDAALVDGEGRVQELSPVARPTSHQVDPSIAVSFRDFTASWSGGQDTSNRGFTLSGINLDIRAGELVVVGEWHRRRR